MNLKSVCVYCGASPGRLDAYAESARALGKALVARDIRLIYGGASIGVMGIVADAVLDAGGQVIGVIPEPLARKEVAHTRLTEIHLTRSMHERKSLMAEMSDAFIALPGGLGTLEELFEIWTWTQLGIHAKPCGLLNVEGYFDKLISFLDHATEEQFVNQLHRSMLLVETNPDKLLDRFLSYKAPVIGTWMAIEEA
ncbi:MAG TPA: TIGR00730 family Rossman fold protein [Burkholderiales bacterium]|nr:TIGR00730 family Rossman fold protein [Burkholderiales bacterium]